MTTSAKCVAALVEAWSARGVTVWLDGGWGVDALLRVETRAHQDVDIVVQEEDLQIVVDILKERNFKPLARDDTRPWNFVLVNDSGDEVDIHVVVFDQGGKGIYGPPENGDAYPAEAFSGHGTVGGVAVRCMSAAFQIENRQGYTLRQKDHHDIDALRKKFDL